MAFALTRAEGPGDAPTFSKSQQENWIDCRRKWAFSKLDGIRKSTPAAEDGSEIHTILENWTVDGIPPDTNTWHGAIAETGLKHLPPPKHPAVAAEMEFFWQSPGGWWYHGLIDILDARVRVPVIIDHKTTGNFNGHWLLKPETMNADRQVMMYSGFAMEAFDTDVVDLMWLYYLRSKKPRSRPVRGQIEKSFLDKEFSFIDETSEEIYNQGLTKTTAMDFPPSLDACGKYGGCPYKDECQLDTEEVFLAGFSSLTKKDRRTAEKKKEKDMSLLDQLKNTTGKTNGAAKEQVAEKKTEAKPAGSAMSALDKLKKNQSSASKDTRSEESSQEAEGLNAPEGPSGDDIETDAEVVSEAAKKGQEKPKAQGIKRSGTKSDEAKIFADIYVAAFQKLHGAGSLDDVIVAAGDIARGAVAEYRKL